MHSPAHNACSLQRQGREGRSSSFKPSRLFLYYLARLAYAKEETDEVKDQGKSARFAGMAADPPRDEMEADDGCYTCDALRAISALGSCAEADTFDSFADKTWPYYELPYGDERANIDWPDDKKMFYALAEQEKSPKGCLGRTPPSKTCFANATHHRTLRYAHPQPMDDVNCWKSLLQGGYPIVFAINVYDTFESSTKEDPYIAKTPTENDKMKYGHIVMAVGWKDNVQDGVGAFRVQNSWGNWADEGFFWMGYDWLSSPGYQQDAWVLLDSEDS